MKCLAIVFILILIPISCKTEEEKLKYESFNNISTYLNSLAKESGVKILDLKLIKLDTFSTKEEMEIAYKLIHDDYLIQHYKVVSIGDNLEKEKSLLSLSTEYNINHYLYESQSSKVNSLQSDYNKESYWENVLYNSYLNTKSKSLKSKNKNFVYLNASITYNVKNPDSTIEPINKDILLNPHGEVYNELKLINDLKVKYIKD